MRPQKKPRPRSAARALLFDLAAIAVGLVLFALVHHVLPGAGVTVLNEKTKSETDPEIAASLMALAPTEAPTAAPTLAPTAAPTLAPTEAPTAAPTLAPTEAPTAAPTLAPTEAPTAAPGDFSALFDGLGLATEEVISGAGKYLSKDVYVRITPTDTGRVVFYVADIWIRRIECFQTAFAKDTYGKGYREYAWDMCIANGGIVAVNGDYYGARDDGVVIRNGALYRDTLYQDVCVLYRDGELATYSAEGFDAQAALDRGAWQAWSFGPALLDAEGGALSEFQSAVASRNPRCGVGYYEPGHYCFVVADGRSDDSKGLTLSEFSLLFAQLGCKAAYNMDGGNTASMTFLKRVVNEPSQGGRPVTDIIMICEASAE